MFREVNRKFSRRGKRIPAEGPQLPSEGPDQSLAVEVSSQGKVTRILHSSQSKKLEYIGKKDSACQAFAYLCPTSTPVNSLRVEGAGVTAPRVFPFLFPFFPILFFTKGHCTCSWGAEHITTPSRWLCLPFVAHHLRQEIARQGLSSLIPLAPSTAWRVFLPHRGSLFSSDPVRTRLFSTERLGLNLLISFCSRSSQELRIRNKSLAPKTRARQPVGGAIFQMEKGNLQRFSPQVGQ